MSTFILRLADTGPPGAVRVAVKDLIDMQGLPTTCGSKVLSEDGPAPADAPCLAGIRSAEAAGEAVIVGKTNMHELAFGVSGINPWFGTPVNPVDPALVPGGSSSGSAVAVAAGDADVALGTDTGGSIRIPAACCGVVGLKTTRGRIPLKGVLPLAPSLDTVGPMGATVAATATGMALLEPGFRWKDRPAAARVGRFRPPADSWVDGAVDDSLARWCSLGTAKIVELDLPGWDAATEAFGVILATEAWSVHRQLWTEHADELSPDVALRLEMGSMIGAEEGAAAWEVARAWASELREAFTSVDLIALPVLAAAVPTLENAAQMASIRYTGPFNLAGVPALALPAPSGGGEGRVHPVPASIQLAGPARSEDLLLATAAEIEDLGSGRH